MLGARCRPSRPARPAGTRRFTAIAAGRTPDGPDPAVRRRAPPRGGRDRDGARRRPARAWSRAVYSGATGRARARSAPSSLARREQPRLDDVRAAGGHDPALAGPLAAFLATTVTRPAADLGDGAVAAVGGDERGGALAGVTVAAPPTVRNTPLAVIDSDAHGHAPAHAAAARARPLGAGRADQLRTGTDLRGALAVLALAIARLADLEDARAEARLAPDLAAAAGRCPLTAAVSATSPLRVSSVEPMGTDATPLSGRKPDSWNGTRRPAVNALADAPGGSLTNTSPETSVTCRHAAGLERLVARGQQLARVADPVGVAVALARVGVVRAVVGRVEHAVAVAVGGGGGRCTVQVRVAGLASTAPQRSVPVTVNECGPSARPGVGLRRRARLGRRAVERAGERHPVLVAGEVERRVARGHRARRARR